MTTSKELALEFVNFVRKHYLGARPLRRLPKGKPGHPERCPVALALRYGGFKANVSPVEILIKGIGAITVPSRVDEFIRRFDAGDYPELIGK